MGVPTILVSNSRTAQKQCMEREKEGGGKKYVCRGDVDV